MEIKKIDVIGTGNIGACQATLIVGNGIACSVIAHSEAGAERCRETVRRNFETFIEHGLATERNRDAAMELLTISHSYDALAGADLVFEAAAEDLNVKHAIYAAVEAVVDADTPIASTTSSIPVDDLCAGMQHPERMLVAHPFQPVHIQPLVELVGGSCTAQSALERTYELLIALDRKVVRLKKSVPGFVVNRLAQAMFRESLYMIEQGVADAADIDLAVRYAVGMRYASIGLLEYFDDVGFDLEKAIAQTVYPDLCAVDSVQQIVQDGIAAGNTGRRAGLGLYDWSKKDDADYLRRKTAPFLNDIHWKLPE